MAKRTTANRVRLGATALAGRLMEYAQGLARLEGMAMAAPVQPRATASAAQGATVWRGRPRTVARLRVPQGDTELAGQLRRSATAYAPRGNSRGAVQIRARSARRGKRKRARARLAACGVRMAGTNQCPGSVSALGAPQAR